MRSLFVLILILIASGAKSAQSDSIELLLSNVKIQIEATEAINDMYNFKFERAEMQFRWIRQQHPEHPLPYYLLGLSQWWKIMPNISNTMWDDVFLDYIDTSIEKAKVLHENPESQLEASFFLAAGYALKGRLYSERGSWVKAANAGRRALKYQRESENMHYLSPEFLFGDALYNYYSVWIRENYPLLRPIMISFPKGDKALGIEQLRQVARNAFYTRTEAQLFLMRILALEEHDMPAALQVSEYLHTTFPDNPYFHRFYARIVYSTGRRSQLEKICLEIIERIDSGQTGYEANSGRYAGFFLGQYYDSRRMWDKAKIYYERAVEFGEEMEAFETGYFLYSMLHLAHIAESEKAYNTASEYLGRIKKYARRKRPVYKEAKTDLKRIRKKQKSTK